ncbi:3643_t:CDS:2 [Paraglomus brasilianum]|uniref:3643_t:CDS:1 n=1 Tax=Paraglomus brasilianum TaxID=144538 RepID=A0A9N9AAQ1_9GLOM|nr:3643_t:CDS:2 [Paraglomus brasilianum]
MTWYMGLTPKPTPWGWTCFKEQEVDDDTMGVLLVGHDLLADLRHIWKCRPPLSKVLDVDTK